MDKVERGYLPPLSPAVSLSEQDRSRVYDLIRKRLADALSGNESYYPEGPKKREQSLASELRDMIASIERMQARVNDPANILGDAIDSLRGHSRDFEELMKGNEPVDKIEMPPELTPMTRDNGVIYVDPDPGPYSPSNPLLPQRRLTTRNASLVPSAGAISVPPNSAYPGQIGSQTASPPLGIVTNQPAPDWPVPPPIFFPWR